MSYIIKNGDLYLDGNGSFITDLRFAMKFKSKAAADECVEAGDRVVPLKPKSRPATLRAQVAEFHAMIGEPVVAVPTMPSDDVVRLGLALVWEESIELMEAGGVSSNLLESARLLLLLLKANIVAVAPRLVPMTDALADIAIVTQGRAQTFGINLDAVITNEVHPSNMAKEGAGKDRNGKWQKPDGWTPPDIESELRRQGWKGEK